MLKFLTTIACLLLISVCFAQPKDSAAASTASLRNEVMIKFAPLSILEGDGGLSFSGEYLFTRLRIGIQQEVQPILFSIYGRAGASGSDAPKDVLQSGPVHGIKLRPEVRYYIGGIKPNQRPTRPGSSQNNLNIPSKRLQERFYLAADFLYLQTLQQRTNEFYINNGGNQQGYRQQAEYTDVQKVTGFEFKVGIVRQIGNEHWLMDGYVGAGKRSTSLSFKNLPSGASEPMRGGFFGGSRGTRTETYPAIPFGIRITYRL